MLNFFISFYKKSVYILLSVFTVCIFLSCGDDNSETGKYAVDKSLQGRWYRLDYNQTFNLTSRTDYEISVIDTNLIQLNTSSGLVYCVRYGNQNNSVKIKLNSVSGVQNKSYSSAGRYKSIGLGNVGGIDVVLSDINNPDNNPTGRTDNNGETIITGVTTGDYVVEVEDGCAVSSVNLAVAGETDGGIITPVCSGHTFKTYFTTYTKSYSSYGNTNNFIYGDTADYDLQVRVRNIGDTDVTAINYEITTDDPLIQIKSGAGPAITGTIEPYTKSKKEHVLDLKFSPKTFLAAGYTSDVYRDVKFNIVFTDVNNIKWYDYIVVRIYRRPMKINFNTTGNAVNGFLISPDHTLKRISTSSGSFIVPFRPDAQYKIMLSNTTASNETAYSIGVGRVAKTKAEMESFYDTSIYEPNDSESTAKELMIGDVITAYLHKGDLDYFIISMNSNTESWEPVVLKYDASAIRESTGNGDNILNFGESVYLDIKLKNYGGSDALGVNAVLSTADSYVTVYSNMPSHGTIVAGSSKWLWDYSSQFGNKYVTINYYYFITVSSDCPAGHKIPFTLTMTDSYGNTYIDTFTLTVNATGSDIKYDNVAILEYSGNGDNILNYGESVYLDIKLKNIGTAATDGVNAVLSTDDSYVTVNTNNPKHNYGTIAAGSSKWLWDYSNSFDNKYVNLNYYYRITVSSDCPVGHKIPFTLTMTDSYGNNYTDTFTLTVQ